MKKTETIVLKDGTRKSVKRRDGKYIYCTDGSQFRPTHPDIKEIVKEGKENADCE